MRKGMFLRLALTNIKKNRGTYIPVSYTHLDVYKRQHVVRSFFVKNMEQ